ncbi:MAG: acyltransferase family protein, partial [Pirellulaceae bacterium]
LLIVGVAPLTVTAFSSDQIASNLTIMPNLLGYECMEPVTWTLQVEVLFYGLILLMFMTGALETPFRTVMWLLALSITTCLSINYLSTISHDATLMAWMTTSRDLLILEYLPLFTIGILLNEIKNKRGNLKLNGLGIAASIVAFHVVDRHDHNPLATLILFVLLAFSAWGRVPFLRFRPLVYISTISYALYLLHNNLGCVFIWHVNQAGVSPWLSMLAGIAFVIAVSALVTYKIEQPLTKYLRGRWTSFRESRQIRVERTSVPVLASRSAKPGD